MIPAVIGQLFIGILLGKGVFNLVATTDFIQLFTEIFAEIGVILLMFLAGIESNLGLLKKYFHSSVLVAIFGVLLPLIGGPLLSGIFHIPANEALFFGITLAATSVSISVEVLKELNVLDTKEGASILGASVLDDILIVLLFSLSLTLLAGSHSAASFSPLLFAEQIGYFLLIYLLVKWIAPYLLRISEKLYATSSVVIMSLLICLGMTYLADSVGLSSVIGAFFAGIAVGQTPVKAKIQKNIEVLGYSLFVPVFFVSVGLEVVFTRFFSQFLFIISFTILAVLTKLLGGYLGARFSHFSKTSALMVGAGMVSRGEMALIILQTGKNAQIISDNYYTSFVLILILTTLISPLLLNYFTNQ